MSDRRYGTRRWRRRSAAQLQAEPLCKFCLDRGITKAASVADHVTPHNGQDHAFWEGPLQSLCKPCHDRDKQREEAHGFTDTLDQDGWPTDPRHLANDPEHAPTPLRAGRGGVKSLGGKNKRPAANLSVHDREIQHRGSKP